MAFFSPRATGEHVLCRACLAMFLTQTEPAVLDETNQVAFAKAARAVHHESVQSFGSAVAAGCTICRGVHAGFPAVVAASERPGVPATTYTLVKNGGAQFGITVSLNVNGLRGVTFFNVAEIAQETTVLNVPASQRTTLVREWSRDCRAGVGKHVACQKYRDTARQSGLQGPRRLIQLRLRTGETGNENQNKSGGISFRLRAFENSLTNGVDVPYATVSYNAADNDYKVTSSLDSWNTLQVLPAWLQHAATAAVATGIEHLWATVLCADEATRPGDIYARGTFNIAVLAADGFLFPADYLKEDNKNVLPIVRPLWAPEKHLVVYQPNLFGDALTASRLATAAAFHRDVLLAPATLFCDAGNTGGTGRLWWQCTEGTLYGDLVATGAGLDAPSAITIYGTHGQNTADWLGRLQAAAATNEAGILCEPGALAERLAAFWTSVVSAYTHDVRTDTQQRASVIDDVALHVQTLVASPFLSSSPSSPLYAHGVWSEGLVEQLAWRRQVLSLRDLSADIPLPKRTRDSDIVSGRPLPSWSWLSIDGPVAYEFMYARGPPSMRTNFLQTRPDAPPRARRVATARFQLQTGESTPIANLLAAGRLIAASLDRSTPLEDGDLLVDGVHDGEATVDWDCVEELARAREEEKEHQKGEYAAWPLFAHLFDAGQVEASGLLLRPVGTAWARCGWFRYSRGKGSLQSSSNPIADLGRGYSSQFVRFLIV